MRIALDAMGGDHAPVVTVAGAVEAARAWNYEVILVGREELIRAELAKHKTKGLLLTVVNAPEVIAMDESPAQAVRQKKNSSIVLAAQLAVDKKADAFLSAGNSGAAMAAALMHMHRIEGVSRPAITTVFPTITGICSILDVGANVDCKPKHLLQFAIMGKVYMQKVFGIEKPRIGLLSIGEEESKGNELTLATFDLLKKADINFIGNVEGRDIPKGIADVVVCDGFVGNIILKFGEGVAEMIFKLVRRELKAHPIAWASLPFLWPMLKGLNKKLDYSEYGAAPLLGVEGICFIGHGGSNAKAIKNGIRTAACFAERGVNQEITAEIAQHESVQV